MRDRTRTENAQAIELAGAGWEPAAIAAVFGITIGGLYRRGARDPALGAALSAIKRPRQVRSPTIERRLQAMWLQPEHFTVADIAATFNVTRQTIHLWARDLGLPHLRHHRPHPDQVAPGPDWRPPVADAKELLAERLGVSETAAERVLTSLRIGHR